MRKALILLTLLLLARPVLAQTPIVPAPATFVAWDYTDTDLAAGAVVRFELAIDGTGASVTPAASKITEAMSYKYALPPMNPGDHVITVRACSADVCGEKATYSFRLVIVPVVPTNLRTTK